MSGLFFHLVLDDWLFATYDFNIYTYATFFCFMFIHLVKMCVDVKHFVQPFTFQAIAAH